MAHYTGKDLYVEFAGQAITGDQRTMTVNRSLDTVDTSAGADTDRSHVATLADADFSLTILDNGTAGSAIRQALKLNAAGTLTYGPEGTATGKPKYQCVATVTGFNTAYPFDGEVEYDVSLNKNGAWVLNFEDSGSVWP